MPTFIAEDGNNSLFGKYDVSNGRLFFPISNTLPSPQGSGHTVWVQPSGQLCIYNGSSWVKFTVTTNLQSSGFNPSNPLISGGLLWWGEPSGLNLNGDSASGITSWTGRTPSIISTALNSAGGENVPAVVSGFLNSYRSVYFGGAGLFIHGGMNLTGSDNDFTVFAVVTPQAISGGGDGALFCAARSSSSIPVHAFDFRDTPTNAIRIFRRDDVNASVDYREPNKVVLSGTHIYTMAFSGTQVATFVDGLQVSSSGMNVGTLTIDDGAIGGLRMGGVNSNYLVGHITEMIVFSSGVGYEGQKGIHSYLSSKYNIPLTIGYT